MKRNKKWTFVLIGVMLVMAVTAVLPTYAADVAPPLTSGDTVAGVKVGEPGAKYPITPIKAKIVQVGGPEVAMYVYALRGPDKTNNPAVYETWATNAVWQIYTSIAIGAKPAGEQGYQLTIPHVAQPVPDVPSDERLWFALRVVVTNRAFAFYPSDLVCKIISNDPANTLAKSFYMNSNTEYIYWAGCLGITWNSDGPRYGDTFYTTGRINEIPVNEFIFIGVMGKYYQAANGVTTGIEAYVGQFPDFQEICRWEYAPGQNVKQYAMKAMHYKKGPGPCLLTCANIGGGLFRIYANADTNNSYIIRSAPKATGPWGDPFTVNGGGMFTVPGTEPQYYFHMVLE